MTKHSNVKLEVMTKLIPQKEAQKQIYNVDIYYFRCPEFLSCMRTVYVHV